MHVRKRIRNGKIIALKKRSIIGLLTTGIILSILLPYVGFFLYAIEDYTRVGIDPPVPDASTFIPSDPDLLAAMAEWFEENIAKYHMPHGMVVNTMFNQSGAGGVPVSYHVSYDSAEWTGFYLMGEAYRWAIHKEAGNETLANHALGNITRVLNAYDKILHVAPNGGMARYAWPLDDYPGGYSENRHLGYWNGSYYIFEADTSRDMHNGVIMGLGMAYHLVNDTATRGTIRRLVTRMLDYFLERGWLYITPEGEPNGTDLDAGYWLFGTGGYWTLAYLKVGAVVNESKYGPLYHEYAIDRDYVHRSNHPEFSRLNLVQSFYALLLDWELFYVLATLETDPMLRAQYMKHLRGLWELVRYTRTPIFGAMWLALNNHGLTNPPPGYDVIGDVNDCLMRYHGAPNRLPGRAIEISNPGLESEVSLKWHDFFNNESMIGNLLYPFHEDLFRFEVRAKYPLTPEKRPASDFLWSWSPYDLGGGGNPRYEGSGVDYTAVYWLARYHGIIAPPTGAPVTLNVSYG